MSIRARVEDALLLYGSGRHEGAFLNALVAVAASARRENPDKSIGDRECFEQFLNKRRRGVIAVEFRGECHPIPRIFYKWFRCELVHEGGLPIDVQFIDTEELSVRAGGAPESVLQISRGWFHWLIRSVIEAPCNASEFDSASPKDHCPANMTEWEKSPDEAEESEAIRAYDAAKASGDEAIPFEKAVKEIERDKE